MDSEPGSVTYEGIRDLSYELHGMAKRSLQDHPRVEPTDSMPDLSVLERDTSDVWFRTNVQKHIDPPPQIKEAIEKRRNRSPFRKIRPEHKNFHMRE